MNECFYGQVVDTHRKESKNTVLFDHQMGQLRYGSGIQRMELSELCWIVIADKCKCLAFYNM